MRLGILARLRLLLRDQGKAVFIEQQEANKPIAGFLEVFTQCVNDGLAQLNLGFKNDAGFAGGVVEESPAGRFE